MKNTHQAVGRFPRYLRCVAVGVIATAAAFNAQAQTFPSGPVTIVVGFTPGGSNDVIARILAPKLSENLGVSVIVSNKPGGAGSVGTSYTINAKPDGHTITLGSTSVFSIGPVANANLPYKLSDLQAVATVAASISMIALNPKVQAKNMLELVALAKTRQVSIASSGTAGSSHLNIEKIRLETGGDFLHVPYKGAAPGISDVIGGQIDGIAMDYSVLKGPMDQGLLRGVAASHAVGNVEKWPSITASWYGVMTSTKVPKSAIKTLHSAFNKTLMDPDVVAKLGALGIVTLVLPNPEEADTYIRTDSAKWAELIKKAGIKLD